MRSLLLLAFTSIATSAAAENEWAALDLSKTAIEKTSSGSMIYATFVVKNPTTFLITDVKAECRTYSPTGVLLQTHRETLFQQFPPGKTVRMKRLVLGFTHQQASGFYCYATGGKADDRG